MDGFDFELGDGALQTSMDVGPPKARKRYSAVIEPMTFPIIVDLDGWDALKTFYYTTTDYGVNRFNITHPLTNVSVEARITRPPKPILLSHNRIRVDVQMIILPPTS